MVGAGVGVRVGVGEAVGTGLLGDEVGDGELGLGVGDWDEVWVVALDAGTSCGG